MKERKLLYLLALTAFVGIIITFCNSRFLGTGSSEATAAAGMAGETQETRGNESEMEEDSEETTVEVSARSPEGPESAESFREDSAADSTAETRVAISPLETAAVTEDAVSADKAYQPAEKTAARSEDNPYRKRLEELDARIQKLRENGNSAGAKSGSGENAVTKNQASDELWLWDSELGIIYEELLKRLGSEQAEALAASQRDWLKNREAEAVEAAKSSSGGSRESMEYTYSLAVSARARAYELVTLYENVLAEYSEEE